MSAVIVDGSPPEFDLRGMTKFCLDSGILDKKLTKSVLDRYFKETNFEEVDQDQNDDNALIRFEFYEIMIRIARGKYMEFGSETEFTYALMKLFQQHIMPMRARLWPL